MKRRKIIHGIFILCTFMNIISSIVAVVNDYLLAGYMFMIVALLWAVSLYIDEERNDN